MQGSHGSCPCQMACYHFCSDNGAGQPAAIDEGFCGSRNPFLMPRCELLSYQSCYCALSQEKARVFSETLELLGMLQWQFFLVLLPFFFFAGVLGKATVGGDRGEGGSSLGGMPLPSVQGSTWGGEKESTR